MSIANDDRIILNLNRIINDGYYLLIDIPYTLQQLTNRHNQAINISPITPPDIIDQLIDYDFNVTLNNLDSLYDGHQCNWRSLLNIISNTSRFPMKPRNSLRLGINWLVGNALINYYILARIPFSLSDDYDISGILDEFDQQDIDLLSESTQKIVHDYSIKNNHSCCLRMLKKSGYPCSVPMNYYSLTSWVPWVTWVENIILNMISNEELYTDSTWSSYLKRLMPQHLIRVPDVNLILTDINNPRFMVLLKRLLPYSDPSDYHIKYILDQISKGNNHRKFNLYMSTAILLVRYKRNLMMEYIDHPFVRHLIEISVPKRMKNSRTNPDN